MKLYERIQIPVYVTYGSYLAQCVAQAKARGVLTGHYLADLDITFRLDLYLADTPITGIAPQAPHFVACAELGGQTWN